MSKFEKEIGEPSVTDLRRQPPPAPLPGRTGKGRGRNREAAEAALRERIAQDEAEPRHEGRQSWRRYALPEQRAKLDATQRELRAQKCACGHRGDKHFRTSIWPDIATVARPCRACPRGECNEMRPE